MITEGEEKDWRQHSIFCVKVHCGGKVSDLVIDGGCHSK